MKPRRLGVKKSKIIPIVGVILAVIVLAVVISNLTKKEIKDEEIAESPQDIYIKNGITTAQDGATNSETLELFKSLADEGKLKLDIVTYPTVVDNPDDMRNNQQYAKKYHNRLKIGGYKLFLDGSPQGKTAWMTEPYEGEESYRGYPWYKDEQVKETLGY